jgi:hypothetical protein
MMDSSTHRTTPKGVGGVYRSVTGVNGRAL